MPVGIDSVIIDEKDSSLLHFYIKEKLAPGQRAYFSYSSENISDKISKNKVKSFKYFEIQNTLTETLLTRVLVNDDGKKISFSFNKQLNNPIDVNGIEIRNKNNYIYSISNFSLASANKIDAEIAETIVVGDSIFVSINSGIFSKDGIEVTPTTDFKAINNSDYISGNNRLNKKANKVFPNPVKNNKVYYNLNTNPEDSILVELYNINGEKLFSKNLLSSSGLIDFSTNGIKKGNYLIKFIFGEKQYKKMIVIE